MDDISLNIDGNSTLGNCLGRMLYYCNKMAYKHYDLAGAQLRQDHPNEIVEGDIRCVNAMSARSKHCYWKKLMRRKALIAKLPSDRHLLEMTQEEWDDIKPLLRRVIKVMTSRPHIRLARATKMSALKRPDLIPACDAKLVGHFHIEGSTDAERVIGLMERFREIAKCSGNLDALRAVKAELAEKELFGRPIELSTTRILEALCWMESAGIEPPPEWE